MFLYISLVNALWFLELTVLGTVAKLWLILKRLFSKQYLIYIWLSLKSYGLKHKLIFTLKEPGEF